MGFDYEQLSVLTETSHNRNHTPPLLFSSSPLLLQGGNWIEYIGNFAHADDSVYRVVSNGVDGWLVFSQ